jgi:CheY-like chemotaxis protein
MIKILHVDDDPDSREQVKFWLTRSSDKIEVTSAESAHDAMEALKTRAYNCIICDYDMPKMDGLQFLTSLRRQGESTAFIILSNFYEEDLIKDAKQAGADDYCSKEVFLAEHVVLLNSIEKALSSRDSQPSPEPGAKQKRRSPAGRQFSTSPLSSGNP